MRRWRLSDLGELRAFMVLAPGGADWELALWLPGERRSWVAR